MNLSQDQREEWQKVSQQFKDDKESHRSNKSDYRDSVIEEFAAGKINRKQAESELERIHDERVSDQHAHADLMAGFMDSLTVEQKQQMIQNIKNLEQRKEEKRRR